MTEWELPPLTFEEEEVTTSVKAYVASVQSRSLELNETSQDPFNVILYRTAAIDHLMVLLYAQADKISREKHGSNTRCCLISQGGYGRQELCLSSDIDLLFLYEGRAQAFIKVLTEKILQPLWDAGLEIGFATRTVRDCRQLMEDDLTILTALIDARWLAGDETLFQEFSKGFQRYFTAEKNRLKFIQKKLEENDERLRRYGESVYLLEPNLKEGRGGLRDYHTIHWFARVIHGVLQAKDFVGRGVLSQTEFSELWNALLFLWKVRNELHYLSGRKNDQLLFEYQEKIAERLGFKNTDHFLGVELFMQKYHQHAAAIGQISDQFTSRLLPNRPRLFPRPEVIPEDPHANIINGKVTITASEVFQQDPLYLLQIFETARRQGLELDNFTIERIRENVFRIDDEFRADPRSGALFRSILNEPMGLHSLLLKMHETKVLGAFLPEFAKLLYRVQHDAYHVYTVDAHSLYAVGESEKLVRGEITGQVVTPSEVIKDVRNFSLLAFAILYHDIGKGEGSGHVEKGAPLIRKAAARLGFSAEEVDLLEFLERSHLIMTHLAFRRDLEEQNLIIQFARSMQTLERLNLLYVLTYCDVKGVSPEAMTDWKASLLEYLYLRTREVLRRGNFTAERISSLLPPVRVGVVKLAQNEEERQRCEDFFGMMAPRYLLATPPVDIYRHAQLWEQFNRDPIVLQCRVLEKERLNEITVFTLNHPGLFSKTTGVLAVNQINILDAELALSNRGHALLTFRVTDSEGQIIEDPEKWQRFERDLRQVLQGTVPMAQYVKEGFRPSFFQKKLVRMLPTRIEIDNDVSAYYTVIDVYAHDRVGLLYQITSTLEALGLYLEVSKISTKVDQISDVFYVKDIFGHKVTSKEKLDHFSRELMKVIDEPVG